MYFEAHAWANQSKELYKSNFRQYGKIKSREEKTRREEKSRREKSRREKEKRVGRKKIQVHEM